MDMSLSNPVNSDHYLLYSVFGIWFCLVCWVLVIFRYEIMSETWFIGLYTCTLHKLAILDEVIFYPTSQVK